MAEPRSKRPRITLPACPAHRQLPGSRVRQSFPPAVEEGLCGVTGALLELAYCLQSLVRRGGESRGAARPARAAGRAVRRRPGAGQVPLSAAQEGSAVGQGQKSGACPVTCPSGIWGSLTRVAADRAGETADRVWS